MGGNVKIVPSQDYEIGVWIKLSEIFDLKVYSPSPQQSEFMANNSREIDIVTVIAMTDSAEV